MSSGKRFRCDECRHFVPKGDSMGKCTLFLASGGVAVDKYGYDYCNAFEPADPGKWRAEDAEVRKANEAATEENVVGVLALTGAAFKGLFSAIRHPSKILRFIIGLLVFCLVVYALVSLATCAYNKVTRGPAPVSPDPAVAAETAEPTVTDVEMPEVKASVNDYTWDELSRLSQAIRNCYIAGSGCSNGASKALAIEKRYHLVDDQGKLDGTQTKDITLSDRTVTSVQIIGFGHDEETAGGVAGITFLFTDEVATMYSYDMQDPNASQSNAGGWYSSRFRSWLIGDFSTRLPSDLSAVIVPVNKLTNNIGETDDPRAATRTSDTLWLLSSKEVFGDFDYRSDKQNVGKAEAAVYNGEGEQYQLFKDCGIDADLQYITGTVLVRTHDGEQCSWFTRTPKAVDPSDWIYIGGGYAPRGILPAFCI